MERSPACAPLCVRAIGLESAPISFRLLHMQPLAHSLVVALFLVCDCCTKIIRQVVPICCRPVHSFSFLWVGLFAESHTRKSSNRSVTFRFVRAQAVGSGACVAFHRSFYRRYRTSAKHWIGSRNYNLYRPLRNEIPS